MIHTADHVLVLSPLPLRLGLHENNTRAHVIYRRSAWNWDTLKRATGREEESRSSAPGKREREIAVPGFVVLGAREYGRATKNLHGSSVDVWTTHLRNTLFCSAVTSIESAVTAQNDEFKGSFHSSYSRL